MSSIFLKSWYDMCRAYGSSLDIGVCGWTEVHPYKMCRASGSVIAKAYSSSGGTNDFVTPDFSQGEIIDEKRVP